jgi:hypothetical protein
VWRSAKATTDKSDFALVEPLVARPLSSASKPKAGAPRTAEVMGCSAAATAPIDECISVCLFTGIVRRLRYCSMLEFGLGHEGPRRFVRVVDRAKLDEEILGLTNKLAQIGQKEWKRSYASSVPSDGPAEPVVDSKSNGMHGGCEISAPPDRKSGRESCSQGAADGCRSLVL